MAAYTVTVTTATVPVAGNTNVHFVESVGKIKWLQLSWWRGLGRGKLRNEFKQPIILLNRL